MNLLPIVEREMRASARHAFTFHLRTLGVAALLLASLVFILRHGSEPNLGGKLFGNLHFTLFCAIWICVPMLTADCLSRERREGTLGLLFLTRLRAGDIVVAKSLAQGLRALTLWLAVLPVLTIPFLLGGISWNEAALSVLLNFSAMCLALAAGLLASSLSRLWTRVLVYATCLSLVLCMLFVLLHLLIVWVGTTSPRAALQWINQRQFELTLGESVWLAADWGGYWASALGRMGTAARAHWLWGSTAASLFALLGLLLAIRFAAWRVRRVWQEEPPSVRILWLEDKFCKPILFQALFRRWMRWKLNRNPIGWLEQRSWSGRLVTWGWLGVITCIYCGVLTGMDIFRDARAAHEIMSWLLAGSMALSAAGSFRRERETGVLELLLVAPLRERDIIAGRVRGLWAQFLPAAGLLLVVWLYIAGLFPFGNPDEARAERGAMLFYTTAFLSMPVIGLYYSLRCRHVITAFLAALAVGLLLPPLFFGLIDWTWRLYIGNNAFDSWEILPSGRAAFCQLIVAGWCWNRLLRRLKRRAFPLERPAK
jgi:ABC-type transport system involved in multi-copper enzyme maturation permease subunit